MHNVHIVEQGKDGSQGGGLRKYCIKGVGWPKSGGLGKKYFKGGPGQKGVNQILRGGGGGGCDLGCKCEECSFNI